MPPSRQASVVDAGSPSRAEPGAGLENVKKLERMGQHAFARGEYADATAYVSKGIKALQTELASLLCLRAAVELQSKEFGNAIADAENAVQLHKGWYKGHLRKGAVLLAMNEPMEAAEHLETALQLSPNQPEVKRTLREAYKSISNNCYEQGYYEFSIRWCDHTIEVLRTEDLVDEEFTQQMSLAYSSRAQANLRQANYREALKDAELCVFYNPWWMKGWLCKGKALSHLSGASDIDAAIDSLEEALLLDPRSTELNQALAHARALAAKRDDTATAAAAAVVPPGDDAGGDLDMALAAGVGDDVPHFHEEWSRRVGCHVLMLRSAESLDVGVSILYDSYLRARNLKLRQFSLETYDFGADDHLLWERVGCHKDGLAWWRGRPALGAVRTGGDMWHAWGDDPEDILHLVAISPQRVRGPPGTPRSRSPFRTTPRRGRREVVNRSFLPYPPMKLTLQVYRTVGLVTFDAVDLLTPLFSSIVYADSASALHIYCYEPSSYSLAKTAVILQMLSDDVPLDSVLQVWFSSGWSLATEAAFRKAAVALSREKPPFQVPYEACVIIQIWSGAPQVCRGEALPMWRDRHADTDLPSLAANLRHAQDRVDYCHYCLTGELLKCDVGSIVMCMPHSEHQVMARGESILQAVPMGPLHTAYHADGTLMQTVTDLIRRRLHIMRLRLRKLRLKVDLYMSPLPPTPVTPLSDPVVAKGLEKVKAHGATHFYWGALPDRYGGHGMAELIERCGAKAAKNHALSFLWNRMTFGTHLMDYDREERCSLLDTCWREAQQAIRLAGTKFFSEKPFTDPHVVCGWGLEKRYHRCWTQHFFSSFPSAAIHSAGTYDFCAFSRQPPLCMCWTPEPADGGRGAMKVDTAKTPGRVQRVTSAPSPQTLQKQLTTSAQCGSCDEAVLLEVKPLSPRRTRSPGYTRSGRSKVAGSDQVGVMMDVFGSAERLAHSPGAGTPATATQRLLF